MVIGGAAFEGEPIVFYWEGIAWTPRIALERAAWGCLALPLVLIAALPFDRFDPARARRRRRHKDRNREGRDAAAEPAPPPSPSAANQRPLQEGLQAAREMVLAPLRPLPLRSRPGGVLAAELRLMLRGRPWWWFAVASGLIAAGAAAPPHIARYVLLAAWLWPLLIWSQMGTREARHRTEVLVFTAVYPLRRQFAATWLAGVLLALAMGSGFAVRILWAGEMARLSALLVGAAFVPTLALACGAWSRTPRLFEIAYLVLWYGALNGALPLDYMGLSAAAVAQGMPRVYLLLTLALLAAAVIGRWTRLRR
jgi:hypothetical protein